MVLKDRIAVNAWRRTYECMIEAETVDFRNAKHTKFYIYSFQSETDSPIIIISCPASLANNASFKILPAKVKLSPNKSSV